MEGLYDIELKAIDGSRRSMNDYRGRTLLIVNVASRCGFTPQYAGLERLYREYRDRGFLVLGFPCNQFGAQEPGSDHDIRSFCSETYDVTFPMFAKVDVNGPEAHPLFTLLKSAQRGLLGTSAIKWNFTKFLVSADGRVVRRYGPRDAPDAIEPEIVAAIAQAGAASSP